VGAKTGLDDVEKRKILLPPRPELPSSTVQPVANRYTILLYPLKLVVRFPERRARAATSPSHV
jgi:hypothetical protein